VTGFASDAFRKWSDQITMTAELELHINVFITCPAAVFNEADDSAI
jgi:hypothetical protein